MLFTVILFIYFIALHHTYTLNSLVLQKEIELEKASIISEDERNPTLHEEFKASNKQFVTNRENIER